MNRRLTEVRKQDNLRDSRFKEEPRCPECGSLDLATTEGVLRCENCGLLIRKS
jgi:transcription elongation factor Elf1